LNSVSVSNSRSATPKKFAAAAVGALSSGRKRKGGTDVGEVLLDVRSQNAVTIWPTVRALLPTQLQNLGNFNFNLIYLNKIYFYFEMQRQKGGE